MSQVGINTKASVFIFTGKLLQRMLGLISTLVLARLLAPEDFGLVAIIWLVLRFINNLAVTGALEYIIQKEDVTDSDINTAWTVDLLTKLLIVTVAITMAPFAAGHYDAPELIITLPVLSTVVLMTAAANPHMFMLKRMRKYNDIFRVELIAKLISVVVTVIAAFALKNYWALIIGHLALSSITLIFSYSVFKYRPQLSLRGAFTQLRFSQWMLLRGIFVYCRANIDSFYVSEKFGEAIFGGYHVTKYIAMMPAVDAIGPATAPLFASFSNVQRDRDALCYQISFALLLLFAIALPVTTLVYINSNELVSILLGSKWSEFTEIFAVLSLAILVIPIYNFCISILLIEKMARSVFIYDLFSFLSIILIVLTIEFENLIDFVWVKAVLDIMFVSVLLFYSLYVVDMKYLVAKTTLTASAVVYVFGVGFLIQWFVGESHNVFMSATLKTLLCLPAWLILYLLTFRIFLKSTTIGYYLVHLEQKHCRGIRIFGRL